MFYSGELQFLRDTLAKSSVQTFAVALDTPVQEILESSLEFILDRSLWNDRPITEFLGDIEPYTMYKLKDFILPDLKQDILFFMGPYTSTAISRFNIIELCEQQKLLPKYQKLLERVCADVPLIPDGSAIFTMLDTFCERIWSGKPFAVVDVDKDRKLPASPINNVKENESLDEMMLNMKLMEKRYHYENQLIQAVTLGQMHKANLLFSGFSELTFEKRTSDPLRNMKNYCIIMNTLLRKAAERGGVHPVYLDSVSSSFAVKIEQISAVSDIANLMNEMFRSYCRLVRKHSMKGYSALVQNAIIFIESDLSANLSLSLLASALGVSAGYLSTAFKRETGKTVTEYIREKRIKHATHLLSTTHLQVQTIALNCGIVDLQYFSKIFKRHTGMSPKEYRDANRQ